MLRKFLLVQLFLFFCVALYAQMPSVGQLRQVNVDNLTDDQIRDIVAEMKQNNLTINDVDFYAQQKGVSPVEADKLKNRIRQLGLDQPSPASRRDGPAPYSGRSLNDSIPINTTAPETLKSRIFGADLFTNKNLTFEPNLRIPTPPNYKLSTDDEVLIDVYGYSEVQYKLTVTSEGYIRIPNLGPVYVNGLTIEEAKNRITKQLSTIYSTISTGKTFVQISLGNIRSIRVLLIGEIVRPGTYTLPSLATIANALYVSGGPDENGSFRDIQVIRNGQAIVTFDLYDFLSHGDLSNNIILQDQDIVKVMPYKTRIELNGEVKRQGIFEAKDNETLQTMLNYAGGFKDGSYKDNITVYRINNKEREVLNIKEAEISSFKLKSGDRFFIDSILSRFSNRVIISGAVFHPGSYGLETGMTVADLIKKADGVKEDASLNRGIIKRLQDDFTPSIINFNVQDVINGKQVIRIQKEDSVVVFSKTDLRQPYTVMIGGQVNNPGSFMYADSMHLEDLILLAGGLTDAASLKHVEISRRIRKSVFDGYDSTKAIILQVEVDENLNSKDGQPFILQPFDEVTIRTSPAYSRQIGVAVNGEVLYPGEYVITAKNERISDIIKRAGGITKDGFENGAFLLRRTYLNQEDSSLLNNKLELFFNKLQDSSDVASLKSAIERKYQLLGLNMSEILRHPGSKYDLFLEEGDILKIPKTRQTIQVFGEVYFPKQVRFDSKLTFRDYIRSGGGFTVSALKRRSYIVYANGDVKNTKKVFFFNSYPKVKPGSEIYVPSKKQRRGLNGQEVLGLATGIASIALIITTILTRTK